MQYIFACHTDAGIRKKINQDSYVVKAAKADGKTIFLAAVCDGVGGLACGEEASGEVIQRFSEWFDYELPQIISDKEEDFDTLILYRWKQLVEILNQKLYLYGQNKKMKLGTTATVILFVGKKYYICHIGDCRVYEIKKGIRRLTKDHSLVEQEIQAGRLTPQEAEKDKRKNIILKCIGAKETISPDFSIGKIEKNAVYLLCSDGFRHKLSEEELYHMFLPEALEEPDQIKERQVMLTEWIKKRGEQDNITVVTVKAIS